MKKIMIAAAVLAALTACNKTLIESPVADSEYGYLDFGISADTEMTVATKSGVSADALNDYYVILKKVTEGNNNTQIFRKKYSEIDEIDKRVAAGTYFLELENLSAADAHKDGEKGYMRIYGISDENATLTAGGTASLSAHGTVVNTAVTVDYDPQSNFSNIFKEAKVTITSSSRSYVFYGDNVVESKPSNLGHTLPNGVFFPANTSSGENYYAAATIKIEAKVNNVAKTFDNISRNLARATWNKITLASGTNGTLTITITADDAMVDAPETITIDPVTGTVITNPAN